MLCVFRVTTIYPVQDQNALQDRRVMSLIQYAKKVEKSMFEVARSRVSALVCCIVYHISPVSNHDYLIFNVENRSSDYLARFLCQNFTI